MRLLIHSELESGRSHQQLPQKCTRMSSSPVDVTFSSWEGKKSNIICIFSLWSGFVVSTVMGSHYHSRQPITTTDSSNHRTRSSYAWRVMVSTYWSSLDSYNIKDEKNPPNSHLLVNFQPPTPQHLTCMHLCMHVFMFKHIFYCYKESVAQINKNRVFLLIISIQPTDSH